MNTPMLQFDLKENRFLKVVLLFNFNTSMDRSGIFCFAHRTRETFRRRYVLTEIAFEIWLRIIAQYLFLFTT